MTKEYTLSHEHDNRGLDIVVDAGIESKGIDKGSNDHSALNNREDDLRCGFGSCMPGWLQVCNNPKAMLVWMSWFAFIQGFAVNGINNVNTASVERRFELSSSQVSLISSAYDISAGIFVLPITYYATYAHQPRLLAISALIMSLGSFIMAVPHFATGLYQLQESTADYCDGNGTICSPEDDGSGLQGYLGVLILGQFLHGIGGTTLYSVGIVFIDTSVNAKSSPLYQGIFYALSALGPALGYLLGGVFLSNYVDIDRLSADEISIDSTDPQWVGAWWLGFLVSGCLAISPFVLLLPYARELPQAAQVRQERVSEAHDQGADNPVAQEGFGKSIKDLPASLKSLLMNPVNISVTIAGVTESFTTAGVATFLPKIIQVQFNQTQTYSAFTSGVLAVVGAVTGMFGGGLASRLLKLKVRGNIILAAVASVVSISATFGMIMRCDMDNEAGTSAPYPDSSLQAVSRINLTSGCNANCHCNLQSYEPMCSAAGLQYFSPCHAGCPPGAKSKDDDDVISFTNCSCVFFEKWDNTSMGKVANDGRCENSCVELYIFLPFVFVSIVGTFTQTVPAIAIALRCIPENQRSFGMGVRWVFMRFLGSVLGPISFGSVIDSTCQVWQYTCDEQGSCWIYDKSQFSYLIIALIASLKSVGLIAYIAAYCFYKQPHEEREMAMEINRTATNGDKSGDIADGFTNLALDRDVNEAT